MCIKNALYEFKPHRKTKQEELQLNVSPSSAGVASYKLLKHRHTNSCSCYRLF